MLLSNNRPLSKNITCRPNTNDVIHLQGKTSALHFMKRKLLHNICDYFKYIQLEILFYFANVKPISKWVVLYLKHQTNHHQVIKIPPHYKRQIRGGRERTREQSFRLIVLYNERHLIQFIFKPPISTTVCASVWRISVWLDRHQRMSALFNLYIVLFYWGVEAWDKNPL